MLINSGGGPRLKMGMSPRRQTNNIGVTLIQMCRHHLKIMKQAVLLLQIV